MPKAKSKPVRPQSADVPDILWCYSKLDDPHVQRKSAPTPGAWNLLLWAREARNRFYPSVLPRVFPPPAEEMAVAQDPAVGGGEKSYSILEMARADFACQDALRLRGVPDEIISSAVQLVDDLNQLPGVAMSEESMTALASHIAFMVHTVVLAAARTPGMLDQCPCACAVGGAGELDADDGDDGDLLEGGDPSGLRDSYHAPGVNGE
jgi:hypothetical protein